MRDCWDEFSTIRPDFSTIRRRFVHINNGKYDTALFCSTKHWRMLDFGRFYSAEGIRERGVVMSICLSLCLCVHSSKRLHYTEFSGRAACGRCSVLLWRHHDKLFTSGFVDDLCLLLTGQSKMTEVGRVYLLTSVGKHGFDTAAYTWNNSPVAALDRGRVLSCLQFRMMLFCASLSFAIFRVCCVIHWK